MATVVIALSAPRPRATAWRSAWPSTWRSRASRSSACPDSSRATPSSRARRSRVLGLDVALFITFFLSSSTNFNLATGAAMSIVLLGLSFLTGASGQISLGNGAFMGVGAFVMAIWANHHATTPIVVTLLIAVACGALVGLLLGLPATRLRGPYLAGMTLAFAVAFIFILSPRSAPGRAATRDCSCPRQPSRRVGSTGSSTPARHRFTTTTLYLTDVAIVVAGRRLLLHGEPLRESHRSLDATHPRQRRGRRTRRHLAARERAWSPSSCPRPTPRWAARSSR